MTAHLIGDENVVHTTETSSGKVHTNNGHPIVGTLQEIVGTLAAIEAGDTAAIVGVVGAVSIGTLAAFEASIFAPTVDATAPTVDASTPTVDALNEGDVASFVGAVGATAWTGTLAAIEAADIASFAATAVTLGTLAATERADVFAATGIVASAGEIIGSLEADEGADTAAFAGVVPVPVVVVVGGGGYHPLERPLPVEGSGYGILPRLEGEAHGVVVGVRVATPVRIEPCPASAGIGAARLSIKAVAAGNHGRIGSGIVMLRAGAVGSGVVGTHGRGSGMVANLMGTGSGQHDDDEAAAVAWMLAA
jgi:hypothetical protein